MKHFRRAVGCVGLLVGSTACANQSFDASTSIESLHEGPVVSELPITLEAHPELFLGKRACHLVLYATSYDSLMNPGRISESYVEFTRPAGPDDSFIAKQVPYEEFSLIDRKFDTNDISDDTERLVRKFVDEYVDGLCPHP